MELRRLYAKRILFPNGIQEATKSADRATASDRLPGLDRLYELSPVCRRGREHGVCVLKEVLKNPPASVGVSVTQVRHIVQTENDVRLTEYTTTQDHTKPCWWPRNR